MPGWCLIESDPAVFTELIERFGARGVAVEEIIGLEPEFFKTYENVYGLILLFKWKAGKSVALDGVVVPDAPVYFAQQTVTNACATLAIVNTLLNHGDHIELGDALTNLFSFTEGMNAHLRGTQVGECEVLRDAHNSFAPSEIFAMDAQMPDTSDVYHYSSFVYKNGSIWELDGLQEGPILAADATDSNYKEKLLEVVRKRIADKSGADRAGTGQGISFSLMAVVDDRVLQLEKQINDLKAREAPTAYLEGQLTQLRAEREKGRMENERRRHNYIPMIVELMKALAEKKKLNGIVAEVLNKTGQPSNNY
ncbi:putative ubiquitin carboxyl-terminal hydrolase, putative,cysteine peptidase, Clan CA, family C12 [Trypanosoma grayi]|uniref:putative ubiquitin carboxyl-terminal hydrolase, putative,cysteine peptidase, Clan CA, family C12 n=1 Tax=Trypanosoma grayi TaxID=71804 RepID=UPI0004F42FBA|nr:putative ubiquitin carboxyl-terminal hydrolase, putative,cysteine peptidase, Clan CA, family C12 [Trypanosoma grayi]KEG12470.1 putative ubiquitin carboxyl-terminal hydrolase, putative,cysteine peptidase, Clan CA, family C12 [Trypanosoma grayi]